MSDSITTIISPTQNAILDKESCLTDVKLMLEEYVKEKVFPRLIYIFVHLQDELLNVKDGVGKEFIVSRLWRNQNNMHMHGACDGDWEKYHSYLWEKNHTVIKKRMNLLRTSMYTAIRAEFIALLDLSIDKGLTFPSLEAFVNWNPEQSGLMYSLFYHPVLKAAIGKRGWHEKLTNAVKEGKRPVCTEMVRAEICYQISNNYFFWIYERLHRKCKKKKKSTTMYLTTDYDIEENDKYIQPRVLDSLFKSEIEVVYNSDFQGSETEKYRIIHKTDEEYEDIRKARLDYQQDIARNAKESKTRLEEVRALVWEESDKVCKKSLKTMGVRRITRKRKTLCSDTGGPVTSSSSEDESTILSKGPTEEGIRFLMNKKNFFVQHKDDIIDWEKIFLVVAEQYSNEVFEPKNGGRKETNDSERIPEVDWRTMMMVPL